TRALCARTLAEDAAASSRLAPHGEGVSARERERRGRQVGRRETERVAEPKQGGASRSELTSPSRRSSATLRDGSPESHRRSRSARSAPPPWCLSRTPC